MSGANYWAKRGFAESVSNANSLTRRGRVYHLSQLFTLAGNASAHFVFNPNMIEVEFEFYDMASDTTTVVATLVESPTVGAPVQSLTPRNLNRLYADASAVVLYSTATMNGGTEVSNELIGAASKAGGTVSQHKHFILHPAKIYGMSFVNQMNQASQVHLNLGWSESEPAPTRLWDTVSLQQ